MTIVGLHDLVKVSISVLLKSFLLIMCIDAPESTTNSRSPGLKVDADNNEALRTNSIDAILEDKELMKMQMDLQKRFPIYHVHPKCMAALLCGAAIRKKASTILLVLDVVGKTLVDWCRVNFHCELIQHPENP